MTETTLMLNDTKRKTSLFWFNLFWYKLNELLTFIINHIATFETWKKSQILQQNPITHLFRAPLGDQ